jgi:predicted esterase
LQPQSAASDAARENHSERPQRPVMRSLDVPGHEPAVVSVPVPRPRAFPLLIAAHGAGDTPEWQCEVWNQIAGERAVILCPRGVAIVRGGDSGYFYRNHLELEKEVVAATRALKDALGGSVDVERAVYTGYSQGATMGALMIRAHADQFPRLVLVEGGHGEWTLRVARAFHQHGGERVLFVCGGTGCAERARKSAQLLERAGVVARSELVPRGGHTYGGAVAERLAQIFDWVTQGDERWR